MPQSVYKDGDVVWVKWGTLWWPGEVWSDTRVPEDIITSLRKPVIAFVKFFQEDSFEFVRSENNISVYNCEKKMEYIKKGMDKYRSSSKIMTNFPADVVKAEQLTGGNANILSTLETPTKTPSKATSAATAANTPTPDVTKKAPQATTLSTPVSASTGKKSAGSYNSSVKVQNTTSTVQKQSEKKLTCTMCSFSTDRMNLLMMHIKSHSLTILSRVNSPSSSSSETRRPVVARNSSKKSDADDGIAEDVRKIKESMKELVQQEQPAAPTKKTRTPAAAKSTPKVRSQAPKREKKSSIAKSTAAAEVLSSTPAVEETNEPAAAAEKSKTDTHGLKNELLADWLDDDDIGGAEKADHDEGKKEEAAAEPIKVSPAAPEKASESSRSIRNIPKKQRVSEMYIQPELNKTVTTVAASKDVSSPLPQPLPVNEDDVVGSTKKAQKAAKRRHGLSDAINEPEKKKLTEDKDDDSKLLTATAELLNETEVPKSSNNNATSPSTFHKSNDIDKRFLPPKERNKRIFRQSNSSDISATPASNNSTSSAIAATTVVTPPQQEQQKNDENDKQKNHDESKSKASVNDDDDKVQISPAIVAKVDRQELILPHKKKQSSRLLTTTEKQVSPVREMRHAREVEATAIINTPTTSASGTDGVAPSQKSEQTPASTKNKRNRKSLDDSQKQLESDTMASDIATTTQSPLREIIDDVDRDGSRKSPSPVSVAQSDNATAVTVGAAAPEKRSKKRQARSLDSPSRSDSERNLQPDSKKFHKSDSPQPRSITVACSGSETICITSRGTISVARRDSIKTTCANSVVVTSHVIISEATTKAPIVTSKISNTDTTPSSSQAIITSPKMSSQEESQQQPTTPPKNALKVPRENIEEMKKQGLVTVENNRTKLTPKGRQKFKEFQDEQSSVVVTSSSSSSTSTSTTTTSASSSVTHSASQSSIDSQEVDTTASSINATDQVERASTAEEEPVADVETKDMSSKGEEKEPKERVCEQDENENETIQSVETKQQQKDEINADEDTVADGELAIAEKEAEKDTEMQEIEEVEKQQQNESTKPDEKDDVPPMENGNEEGGNDAEKEKDTDVDMEAPAEDANSGGAGLIALQAETFGGPPNCFYLCRPVEGGYEPVDNQILVLNAQNALVPYDGEIAAEAVQEAAYSQLSPNSNIIINTPNGQKIELSHYAILALQEQADENGIASVELSGEQLELNINGILEAISAQQQDLSESGDMLSAVLVGEAADVPLLIDPAELPAVEVQTRDPSVATQVSETLSKPIMSCTVAPEIAINPSKSTITETVSKNLNIEDSLASIGVKTAPRANVPKSLELPITVTNPTIAETVNHRKLATAILGTDAAVPETFVIVPSTDNGSVDN